MNCAPEQEQYDYDREVKKLKSEYPTDAHVLRFLLQHILDPEVGLCARNLC